MDMPSPLPSSLIEVLNNLRMFSYFDAASVTILAYDYLLTFPDEVKYIWKKPLSPVTFLFYAIRYQSFVDNALYLIHEFPSKTSSTKCVTLYESNAWSYLVGVSIADIVLILRTAAIWGNNKLVLYGLSFMLAAIFIPSAYFINQFLNSLVFEPVPTFDFVKGCFIIGLNDHGLFVDYAVYLFFESTVLLLTLAKIKSYREGKFAKTLYRDSVVFYFCIFALSAINIVVLLVASPEISGILIDMHRVIHAVLTGRIILNIRQASSHQMSLSTGNAEAGALTTFMVGEDSRWRSRLPGVSTETNESDDIPLEDRGGPDYAEDEVSGENSTNEGMGKGKAQGEA